MDTDFLPSLAELTETRKMEMSPFPDSSWDFLRQTQVVNPFTPMDSRVPKPPGHLRFVAISDTHRTMGKFPLPQGDVLLHCGDFTNIGRPKEISEFVKEFAKTDFQHRIGSSPFHFHSFIHFEVSLDTIHLCWPTSHCWEPRFDVPPGLVRDTVARFPPRTL